MTCAVSIDDIQKWRKIMAKLFVTIFLIVSAMELHAQSYKPVHYDTKDGLPSSTVYDVTQDKDGFIWFGTENGLCRFDGKNFKIFTTRDGLPDNSILKVQGDSSGRVYFQPFTHSLYYYQNDSFFRFPAPERFRQNLSNINGLNTKGKQLIIAGYSDSYTIDNNQISSINDRMGSRIASAATVGMSDTLMMRRLADTFYYIPDTGKIMYRVFPELKNIPVVFYKDGIFRKVDIGNRSSFTARDFLGVDAMYEYFLGYVIIYDMATGKPLHKIRMEKMSDVFIDNEKSIWISTIGNGVYRFSSFQFRNIEFDGKSEIFSIITHNGRLLAGTDYSKAYSMPVNDTTSAYATTDFTKIMESSPNPASKETKRNRIYVLRTSGETLYMGADAFMSKRTGTKPPLFKYIYPVKDIDILGDSLLVCTGSCALLVNEHDLSVMDTLLRQRSTCGVAYKGNFYVGTLGGLVKINPVTKVVTELFKTYPAFSTRIVALKRGLNDDLWIATSGSGLVHFKDDHIIEILRQEDGLTSDISTSLFLDGDLLWLGTNNGLNRIEIKNERRKITRLTSANGLGADFINTVITNDSYVYIGTGAGLTIFNKNVLAEKSICTLHILEVSANNTLLKRSSSYSLPHNTMNIQVQFTAISFKSAGDITYYYQLEGLDKTWNTTTANFVNFPTLQPASYTFHVKAVNKFGVESETKSIRIIVRPAWWQTWAFRIGVLLIVALAIFLIYRYNIQNIKKRESQRTEIEMRFAALEQRALQAQMNPHFIFNCLNSIQTFILNFDAEGANTYLTTFASLIRQTLENSMHPLISVASELKYLETYLELEKLRFRDKFRYQIELDENIDVMNAVLPGMLLQPYVENSLRHGIQHRKDNDGLISLVVAKTNDGAVLYTITDNGVGRKRAMELKSIRHIEYQSRGSSIGEKRIVAINSQYKTNITIHIEDITGLDGTVTGTKVSVLIPAFINNVV